VPVYYVHGITRPIFRITDGVTAEMRAGEAAASTILSAVRSSCLVSDFRLRLWTDYDSMATPRQRCAGRALHS